MLSTLRDSVTTALILASCNTEHWISCRRLAFPHTVPERWQAFSSFSAHMSKTTSAKRAANMSAKLFMHGPCSGYSPSHTSRAMDLLKQILNLALGPILFKISLAAIASTFSYSAFTFFDFT